MSVSKPGRLWLAALLLGAAIFLSAKLGTLLSVSHSNYVSFWLPAGFYLGALLLNEMRTWPWFVLAATAATFLFDSLTGTPLGTKLGFCVADTLEAVAGAWLVRRFVASRPGLTTLSEFLGLMGYAVIFSPMLGAAIGAATLTASGMIPTFWGAWGTWWGNSAMAISLVTPLLLVWFDKERVSKPRGKLLEAALLTAALASSSWYLLVVDKGINSPYKTRLLPLLLWAGLRFGLRGATLANFFLALLMGFFTTHFLKGLTPEEIASGSYVATMQSFLMVSVVMVLIPTIVIGERNRKVVALEESEERFRRAFDDAPIGMSLVSPEGCWLKVNQVLCRMLGYSETELLQSDFQRLSDPVDLEKDLSFVRQVLAGTIPSYQMEKRYFHKNGPLVSAMLSVSLVRSRGGRTALFRRADRGYF